MYLRRNLGGECTYLYLPNKLVLAWLLSDCLLSAGTEHSSVTLEGCTWVTCLESDVSANNSSFVALRYHPGGHQCGSQLPRRLTLAWYLLLDINTVSEGQVYFLLVPPKSFNGCFRCLPYSQPGFSVSICCSVLEHLGRFLTA